MVESFVRTLRTVTEEANQAINQALRSVCSKGIGLLGFLQVDGILNIPQIQLVEGFFFICLNEIIKPAVRS